jgi:hypothetical protein
MADTSKPSAPSQPQATPAPRDGEAPPELDETVPGGAYLVNDQLVDAWGNPVQGDPKPGGLPATGR